MAAEIINLAMGSWVLNVAQLGGGRVNIDKDFFAAMAKLTPQIAEVIDQYGFPGGEKRKLIVEGEIPDRAGGGDVKTRFRAFAEHFCNGHDGMYASEGDLDLLVQAACDGADLNELKPVDEQAACQAMQTLLQSFVEHGGLDDVETGLRIRRLLGA